MQLLMNLVDESKQLNQAQFPLKLGYHGPKGRFKIIHQGLMIPNLPAPLYYLNFLTIIGQPNIPMIRNPYAIHTTALDTAMVISSSSPHMLGHFKHYSIQQDCQFTEGDYHFGGKERLQGSFPYFRLTREDDELAIDLNIYVKPIISHFTKLRLGVFDHWSLLCQCKGQVKYKGQVYAIDQMGSFEYARAMNIPYLPLCFFTYQIINLKDKRQLLLAQIRNNFNQIVQSRIYLRDESTCTAVMFDDGVYFKVHRVYPKVTTPNQQDMYLPREFEWCFSNADTTIQIHAQSRGDFKFGLAAGYVGSFTYQLKINDYSEEGSAGYCEYIDCRPLRWQEKKNEGKKTKKIAQMTPNYVKK
ncbi:DUF6670 family protein [Acinetobacter sp. ANC 4648]|uniref:DUF6670 family protein n=1 Tax=Acinetobacter sp. ANC 4648 TaxID=1977875 RepID=UPI000A33E323|nr:DUF6670 family protein [Acinetobacter sp. ANC 4648]OTG80612.1 hypothetical protein B9T27_12095 [Acinetobacter sp. ANC 4648]